MSGVYRIRNKINNKCYYGSSKNINKRFNRHKNQLNKNNHYNIILQRAWNKYGESNFIFEIVKLCNEDILLKEEQKYLNKNPKYNIGKISKGGDNLSNHPYRDEIINRMTDVVNDRYAKLSKKERKEIYGKHKEENPNWKGGKSYNYCECGKRIKPRNDTCFHCRDVSGENNPFYGKTHTKKVKEKIRKARQGKYFGNQNKEVLIDGNKYKSLSEAAVANDITPGAVHYRLNSKNYPNCKYLN